MRAITILGALLLSMTTVGCFAKGNLADQPSEDQAKYTLRMFDIAQTRTTEAEREDYYFRAWKGADTMIRFHSGHSMVQNGDAAYIAAASLGYSAQLGIRPRFERGVKACEHFLMSYPRHDKVPDGYLRKASYQESLQLWADARVTYAELIDKYPSTPEADVARRQVDFIDRFKTGEQPDFDEGRPGRN